MGVVGAGAGWVGERRGLLLTRMAVDGPVAVQAPIATHPLGYDAVITETAHGSSNYKPVAVAAEVHRDGAILCSVMAAPDIFGATLGAAVVDHL